MRSVVAFTDPPGPGSRADAGPSPQEAAEVEWRQLVDGASSV
jgi:hypothetical protein